jgi:antirestriction protein ArdC
MADTAQIKEITSKLEQGIKDLYESDSYVNYLKTMSRFHKYSTRNTLLIYMQKPDSTVISEFTAWKNKFGRSVNKGEKAIKIFAPVPFKKTEEKEKLDPDTRRPILDEDSMPVMETTKKQVAGFKVVNVFDLSQTAGKPLPSLAQTLMGDLAQYEAFLDALRAVSPLPIVFEPMPDNMDGLCCPRRLKTVIRLIWN